MEGTRGFYVVPKASPLKREDPPEPENEGQVALSIFLFVVFATALIWGGVQILPPLFESVAAKLAAHPEFSLYVH